MTIETNKALVTEFFARLAQKNAPRAFELVSEDARWWCPRGVSVPGSVNGEVTRDVIRDMLADEYAAVDGPFTMDMVSLVAEGDQVACELAGSARFRDGFEYNNSYCFVFTIRDGVIRHVKDYLDTVVANQLAPHATAKAHA
jgi:ketosteroid isomerase-like protein